MTSYLILNTSTIYRLIILMSLQSVSSKKQDSHVVLDESLDFVAGVFILTEFDRAVFKLVVELGWTEQNDSPVSRERNISLTADTKVRPNVQ